MIKQKELICISCPLGCHLVAKIDTETNEISIEGNRCPRGEVYGKEELLSPKRVVTATVKINSKYINRIPVKTNKPIDKNLINNLLKELYSIEVSAPKKIGEKLITNYKNTNVDVVFTRTIEY